MQPLFSAHFVVLLIVEIKQIMARIVYGVAGQGFGHSTRSKEIIQHLKSQGHEVMVFTYGQALFFLDKFGPLEIPGLTLTYKNNRVSYKRTLYRNALNLIKHTKDWEKIRLHFKYFSPDLVITDFEPLTSLLAKMYRRPLVSLDNQHQLTNTKIPAPEEHYKDFKTDRAVVKFLVWGAKYYIVTTFYETPIIKKNTYLVPPILRQGILDLRPTKGDYYLVYQNSDFEHLVKVLQGINEKFVVFGMNVEKIEGNITFKNYSSDEWLKYLQGAKAVIGTAGLSLITECLYLKKPYLAEPVQKQFEQFLNAHYLEENNFGAYTYNFTADDFYRFRDNLPRYETALAGYSHQDNSQVFAKIDEVIKALIK